MSTWEEKLRPEGGGEGFSSQRYVRDQARKNFEQKEKERESQIVFQPAGSPNTPVLSRLIPVDHEAGERAASQSDSGN